jgi:hypothetical protein
VSDVHHCVPVVIGGATKVLITVTRCDNGSTDLGGYGCYEVSSTCVLSFRDDPGALSIGFRAPPDDVESRVGAMISQ